MKIFQECNNIIFYHSTSDDLEPFFSSTESGDVCQWPNAKKKA